MDIDLSKPETIVWPFELSVVGDLGETGLRIPPKAGTGWNGKAGGEATYRFHVPEDGDYHLWAYCRWFDQCANAVYTTVDRMDKAVLGNNPIYGQWHWVRGLAVPLSKGPHALKLSNHSDHIAIQRVRFINSGLALPDDCGVIFSDVFYDGFDGCHIGNFASWEPWTGQWEVQHPRPGECLMENALRGTSESTARIVYAGSEWSGYSLHVAVRSIPSEDPNAAAGILFGVLGPEQFYELRWRPCGEIDHTEMELCVRQGEASRVLATFSTPALLDKWHDIEVALDEGTIRVNVDDQQQAEVVTVGDIAGGIGLCLRGECTALFDEIHVRTTSTGTQDTGKSHGL